HWRHSRTDTPATDTDPPAEPSGYKPLRWRHTRDHSPAEGGAESRLSAADEHAVAEFQRVLGMVPEISEPDRAEAQQDPVAPEAGPAAWRGQVIEILRQAGPDAWMSTRAIREALAAQGLELGRQIVSEALAGMARKKHIRTRGTGPTTEYSAQPR
ncbi:hypothetical protein KGQ20_15360, partial [Catenulispora sp. NF23]|uniref:hypothetical protein n=1 Tax=Catenulispora pinistramenti TaxID=2705254 RepID=UPI001BAAF07E